MEKLPLWHGKEQFSFAIGWSKFIWIQSPFVKIPTTGIGNFLLFMN